MRHIIHHIFLFLFVVTTTIELNAKQAITSTGVEIDLDNLSDDNAFIVRRIINESERCVAMMLPRSKAPDIEESRRYTFRFSTKKYKSGIYIKTTNQNKHWLVDLPSSIEDWTRDNETVHSLIAFLILKHMDYPSIQGMDQLPRWLVTALVEKTWNRLFSETIPGPKIYPGVHAIAMTGVYPSLNEVINKPLPPSFGPAYRLYAEICELLFDSTMKSHGGSKKTLEKMLRQILWEKKSAFDAYSQCLGELLEKKINRRFEDFSEHMKNLGGNTLERWFHYNFRRRGINQYMPASLPFVKAEFQRLMKVEYRKLKPGVVESSSPKEEDLESATCELANLHEHWKEVIDKEKLINSFVVGWYLLKSESPEIFYPTINKITQSFEELKDDDPEEFKEMLDEGLVMFKQTVVKYDKIESYFDSVAQDKQPFIRRHYSLVNYFRSIKGQEEDFWPLMKRYFDKVEKDYLGN